MAQADAERSSYGGVERFLFYSIPVLFTLILTGVLLSIFGYDVPGEALKIAQKIPLVNKVVPSPSDQQPDGNQLAATGTEEEDTDLNALLDEKEKEITVLQRENKQQEQIIAELEERIGSLEQQLDDKVLSEEEYRKQIREIAEMYARMTPSKSAPIIQNLTTSEMVLILHEMKLDDRLRILEKMDPKVAAEVSIQLKDVKAAKDLEIAALQSRLELNKNKTLEPAKVTSDLTDTIENMPADSAANVLLEMWKNEETGKVIQTLKAVDTPTRSAIVTGITKLSKQEAAKIAARLGE